MKNKIFKCSICGEKLIELEGFGGILTYCEGCNHFTEYEFVRYLTEQEEAEYQKILKSGKNFRAMLDFANTLN